MATTTEQRKIEIIANGKRVNASLKEMEAAAAVLTNQFRKLERGTTQYADKAKELRKVRSDIRKIKEEAFATETAMTKLTKTLGPLTAAFSLAFFSTKVIEFFTGSSNAAKEFEKSLSSLSSLTGATGSDLEFYEAEAQRIGQTTTLSASQAVEAFKLMGSAKPELLKSKEALVEVTESAVTLAEAAEIDLPSATKALAGALNQFNLPATESGRLINVLAAGSKAGAAEIPDIAAAMDKAGLTAANFNVSVEESVALIEVLSKANVKGAEAGTALRNVLLKMQTIKALPNEAVDRMRAMGVNMDLVADKSQPLEVRLTEFSKVTGDATTMAKVFGTENINAGQAILGNIPLFQKYTKEVTGTNTAVEQAATNTDNLSGDTKALASAYEGVQISVGKFLNDALRPLVQFTTSFLLAMKEAPKVLKENADIITFFGIALGIMKAETIASTAVTATHIAIEKGRAIALQASAIAQRLLNTAMTANPVGLVIKAVALLVSGFVLLYNRSENVRAGIAGLASVAQEVFKIIKETVGEFIGGFQKVLDGDVIGGLKDIGMGLLKANPIGLAATEGKRLAGAFAKGYLEKKKEEHAKNLEEDETQKTQEVEQAIKFEEQKNVEIQKIDKKAREDLKKQREEYQKLAIDAELALQQLRIDVMADGLEKELALIDFKHERELEKLDEQREKVLANKAISAEEEAAFLANLEEQRDILEEERKIAKEEAEAEQREEEIEKQLQRFEEDLERELLARENSALAVFEAENSKNAALQNITLTHLRKKLDTLKALGLGETKQAMLVKNEILRIENDKNTSVLEDEKKLHEAKLLLKEQEHSSLLEFTDLALMVFKKNETAQKALFVLQGALAIGNIIRKTQQEIAGYYAAYSLIPGGVAIASGLAKVAKIRAGISIATVAAQTASRFEDGGSTLGGEVLKLVLQDGIYKYAGKQLNQVGTYASGGAVDKPSLGVIGEAGPEWVGPNWMIRSPKYANIFSFLESERLKARPFVEGGPTSGGIPALPDTTIQAEEQAEKMDMLIEKLDFYASRVDEWASTLKVINDPNETEAALAARNEVDAESTITR